MTITTFASGELSQNLKGRTDLPQYFSGAQKISNFEIIPTGGIRRRVGFQHIGALHGPCRLIPFIIDRNVSFILEFTARKIYIWRNGTCIDENGIPTKYGSVAEIDEIQYAQNYDRLIFTHRNYRPLEIRYDMGLQRFIAQEMTLKYYIAPNLDDDYGIIKQIDASEILPETAEKGDYAIYRGHLWKCVKASDDEYAAEWEIDGEDPAFNNGLWEDLPVEQESKNAGKYPGCVTFFQNRLYFASTKNHPQRIWASAAPDTDDMRYDQFGIYQKYVTTNKTIKDPDIHLFTANILMANIDHEHHTTTLTGLSQDLTEALKEPKENYYVINSNYAPGGSNVKIKELSASVMVLDKELAITEDMNAQVFTLSLWRDTESASAEDYEYVVVNNNTTTPDCAFYLEPASDQNNAIKWLAPAAFLAVGTESDVWNIPSGVNALNIQAVMNGRYGSDDVQAHVLDTAVIFFAQGKSGIREYYYNSQNEAFQTNNIAILAEHMLKEAQVHDFDFCTNPYNRLIITREDGIAVTLLYDKNNGVMGWNRIEHGDGRLKSCAVTRGSSFTDLIYFAVEHPDGSYTLECLDEEKEVYLDSWFTLPASEKDNLDDVLQDNSEWYEDGELIYVGVPFKSVILSMPVVTQDVSQKKRIVNLHVRFNDSYMPVMKTTGMPDEYFNGVPVPFSGVRKIDYPGTSLLDVTFELEITEPKPCNILSVDASLA